MKLSRIFSIIMILVVFTISLVIAGPAPMMDKPTQSVSFVQSQDGVAFEFPSLTLEFQAIQPSFNYQDVTSVTDYIFPGHVDIGYSADIAYSVFSVSGGDPRMLMSESHAYTDTNSGAMTSEAIKGKLFQIPET